jgi:hypothetical protein
LTKEQAQAGNAGTQNKSKSRQLNMARLETAHPKAIQTRPE